MYPLLLCETAKKARPAGHNQPAACAGVESAKRRQERVKGNPLIFTLTHFCYML